MCNFHVMIIKIYATEFVVFFKRFLIIRQNVVTETSDVHLIFNSITVFSKLKFMLNTVAHFKQFHNYIRRLSFMDYNKTYDKIYIDSLINNLLL